MAAKVSSTPSSETSIYPTAYCVPSGLTTWEQTERWNTFVNKFYIAKNLEAANGSFVAADYIQHNPDVGQGPAAAIAYLSPFWQSTTIKILHLGFDNPFGWIHFRVDGLTRQPLAITDMYRFNQSCVQEHWDIIQARPLNATNPLALF